MRKVNIKPVKGDALGESLVITCDDQDQSCGGASHNYDIADAAHLHAFIHFQHGALKESESKPGCTDASVLAILIDRYEGFQSGKFACEENAEVLTHLNLAKKAMEKRVKDRLARGVLGKNEE